MEAGERAWIDRFLAHLRGERRLSAHTGAAYARDLQTLREFCERRGLARWSAVGDSEVRSYAAAQHAGGCAPRTIQRRLSAVRTFYDYLGREGADGRNPARDVQAPKGGKRLPATIDADGMASLLQPGSDGPLAARDRAIMELFYSSGLRLAELVGLDLTALDLADRTVRVLGKGGKTRIVPVGGAAAAALGIWLGVRSAWATAGHGACAVFIGRGGRRLTARAVQLRVDAWGRRHGSGTHLHPHLFRHSFASHLLESSGDLRGVQELLGHADIGTTQVYTHLDFQHLAKVYDAAHPRARRRPRPA
jgi:integrase/recombinase XerC